MTHETLRPESDRKPRTLRLVALAVALASLVVFVAENYVLVEVRFFTVATRTRLAWGLIIASAFGFVVGYLVALRRR